MVDKDENNQIAQDVSKLVVELKKRGINQNTTEDEMEGLGDVIEAGLNAIGITQEGFKKLFGLKECNCTLRKKYLNNVLSWHKKKKDQD